MQAADGARAVRLQKLAAPADKGKGGASAQGPAPPPTPSMMPGAFSVAAGSRPAPAGPQPSASRPASPPAATTVSLMPHVGVQVIPPVNFGMVEDGLYRWSV